MARCADRGQLRDLWSDDRVRKTVRQSRLLEQPRDRAVWTIEAARPGRYAVWLDWACHADAAGKQFLFQAGINQTTGKVSFDGRLGHISAGEGG